MLDIQFVRDNPKKVKQGVAAKQFDPGIVEKVLEVDKRRRTFIAEVEALRLRRNEISREGKASEEGKRIKEEIKEKERALTKAEDEFRTLLSHVPNLPLGDVKVGKDETENEVVRTWGEQTKFSFEPKDHLGLGEQLGVVDVERASKVSGSRFGYLSRDAVLLEFALVQYALDTLTKEGFIPIIPPVLIKRDAMRAMGYMEHGGEEDMYVLDKDDMVLVGTSEQSIAPMHRNEVLDEKSLPLRYVGFSTCFRRESGSYGKDTRGILRVHQFDKVEMVSFTKPEDSDKEHEFFLSLEEKFLQALGIPYQVVKMCSGDLGAPAARKYDLEAWMPGQGKYREVTSTSTTTDYQARRLHIKYKNKDKVEFVHILNGTAFAIGRTIVAILENYQQADGSVLIPKVLQPYMGKEVIRRS